MPRHNRSTKIRAQYSGQLRDSDRAKRRARIASRKRDQARAGRVGRYV